jgi:hypothetical protein
MPALPISNALTRHQENPDGRFRIPGGLTPELAVSAATRFAFTLPPKHMVRSEAAVERVVLAATPERADNY